MKVLLINPPIREWSKPNVFPLGLGYIASVLLKDGHDVWVMDINGYRWDRQKVEEMISGADYDVVGIGGIITIYKYVKWLVSVLKKHHPGRKIIVGGSVGSSIPAIMLGSNPVDIVVIGEGEETIKELISVMAAGGDLSSVNGICYKDDKGGIIRTAPRQPVKDLDSIALPAWDLFPMDIYLKNPVGAPNRNKWIDGSSRDGESLSMNIYGTRGCPYQCVYCYHDFMGARYRTRSPGNIMEEIKQLYNRYGVKYFHFIDDEFVVNRDFTFEFCRLVKEFSQEIGSPITWGCAGRVNLMTEDMIIAMSQAGCVLIGYGIESGSQAMLDFIKKRVTITQAKKAVALTRKHLGWADTSFMIGYPGETKQSIQETIDFCKELELVPEVIFFLTPYPGTRLYEMALNKGMIKNEEEYILSLGEQGEKIRINFTNFSDKQLYEIQANMIDELKAWNKVRHS
ncbi:MAG: radical SAM protein [Candidatus Omnitrophica bacterium]|nr:radical SAM protein [Candidatus Omnitrophota bacterium]